MSDIKDINGALLTTGDKVSLVSDVTGKLAIGTIIGFNRQGVIVEVANVMLRDADQVAKYEHE